MKLLKRLLVSLLVLALALGLALPAFSVDDPAMPVITVQPQGVSTKQNQRIVLSVEAHIPNGDEIGYQWYCGSNTLVGQTGACLEIKRAAPTDSGLYYVEVYNRGDKAFSVRSAGANVKVSPTLAYSFMRSVVEFFWVLPYILLTPFAWLWLKIMSLFG